MHATTIHQSVRDFLAGDCAKSNPQLRCSAAGELRVESALSPLDDGQRYVADLQFAGHILDCDPAPESDAEILHLANLE